MSYTTKKALIKLLKDNGITTTAKTLTELVLIALDNEVVKREDVVPAKKPEKGLPVDLGSTHQKR